MFDRFRKHKPPVNPENVLRHVPADSTWKVIGQVARTLYDESEGEETFSIPFEDPRVGMHLSGSVWQIDDVTGESYRMNDLTSQVISDAIGREVRVSGFYSGPSVPGDAAVAMIVSVLPVVVG